jgi:hypothetical protein
MSVVVVERIVLDPECNRPASSFDGSRLKRSAWDIANAKSRDGPSSPVFRQENVAWFAEGAVLFRNAPAAIHGPRWKSNADRGDARGRDGFRLDSAIEGLVRWELTNDRPTSTLKSLGRRHDWRNSRIS